MNVPRAARFTAALAAALLLPCQRAQARDISCGAVDSDVIQIDGLLGDWKDVPGLITQDAAHIVAGKAWDGPDDLSFIVRCNYDDRRLYLAVDVRDDRLVRTRKAQPQEDHVIFTFGAGRQLVVWPGDLHADIPRVVKWARGRPPAGIEVAESMQPRGWSVEVAIPWKLVPGWSPGVAQVRGAVAVADADWKAPLKQDCTMSTSEGRAPGALVLGEGDELMQAFLKQVGARKSDIVFD
jgi:hypothetical protein